MGNELDEGHFMIVPAILKIGVGWVLSGMLNIAMRAELCL